VLAQDGGCPPGIPTIPELSLAEYLGQWYTQYHIPLARLEEATCIGAEYGEHEDPGKVSVHNVATLPNGTVDQAFGYAFVSDPEVPGQFTVQFPGSPPSQYYLLDTDYSDYAVIYACAEFGGSTHKYAWINSRGQELAQGKVVSALFLLSSIGVEISQLVACPQPDSCDYGYGA